MLDVLFLITLTVVSVGGFYRVCCHDYHQLTGPSVQLALLVLWAIIAIVLASVPSSCSITCIHCSVWCGQGVVWLSGKCVWSSIVSGLASVFLCCMVL